MTRLQKYRLLFAISCWSVIISLYVSQGLLWLFDPHRKLPINGWVGEVHYTWGNLVNNNRFGYREREFEIPKPSNVWRVMVLGDSLTWGAGLSESERYTNILEEELRSRFNANNRIEVLNFGIEGGPTTLERDIALKYFDKTQPDLLVVGFCLNDPQPRSQDYSFELEHFEATSTYRLFSVLLATMRALYLSNIADTLHSAVFKLAQMLKVIPAWQVAMDRAYDPSSPEWKDFLISLQDIKKLSEMHQLPNPIFVILNQALEDGTANDYRRFQDHLYLKWYRQAAEAASREGFQVIEYRDEIRALPPSTSLVLNQLDSHPSSILNKVYAKKLFSVIQPIVKNLFSQ